MPNRRAKAPRRHDTPLLLTRAATPERIPYDRRNGRRSSGMEFCPSSRDRKKRAGRGNGPPHDLRACAGFASGTGVELERIDLRAPVERAGRLQILRRVVHGAVVARIDRHCAVVAPTAETVDLTAAA